MKSNQTTKASAAYVGEDSLVEVKPRNSIFTESSLFASGAIKVQDCTSALPMSYHDKLRITKIRVREVADLEMQESSLKMRVHS